MTQTHKITALTLQKRNRQRVNIYLDGEFAFGVSRIVAAWLQVGQEIDEQKIAQLKDEDERESAYQLALRYLGHRPRSEHEVRTHLHRKGVSNATIEITLKRLIAARLVNDEAFAHQWVENRLEYRPRSLKAITYELRTKGIREEIITNVLSPLDETQLALRAAQLYARKLSRLPRGTFRQKMIAHLAQKGFPYTVANQVALQVWAEISAEEIKE